MILEELAAAKKFPSYLRVVQFNMTSEIESTWQLQEAGSKSSPNREIDFGAKPWAIAYDDAESSLIDGTLVQLLQVPTAPLNPAEYEQQANALSASGQHLGAICCAFEYVLASGDMANNIVKTVIESGESDTLMMMFVANLQSPRSEEEAMAQIERFQQLIAVGQPYGHVMHIFCANYISPASRFDAIDYFIAALQEGPRITGAWRDLGDLYTKNYTYDLAWKCYEIAMRLNIDHPMAQEQVQKKADLKARYPSYFLGE